jgi:hypothetical protein
MAKGRVSEEELQNRLSETARLLIRRRSYLDVERGLAQAFKVDKRTARKWIAKVKAQWRADAAVETADESRDDLIQQLDAVIALAYSNTVVIKDSKGDPVLDQAQLLPNGQPNPGYMKPLVKADPKIQHILHAVSQLRALKGADRPAKHHVTLDGDINVMPDVEALPDTIAAELRRHLEEISGGDIRKLAGEWFHVSKPDDDGG